MRRRQVQRARAPAAGGGATRGRGRGARAHSRAGARSGAARQEQRRPAPDMLYVVGLGQGDKKDITVKGLEAVHWAVRRVRLGGTTGVLRSRCADNEGCARAANCMMSTKSRRHRDITMTDRAALIFSLSCLAPRARDLAGGLVRGPVQLLARPAAVLDALARTALVAAAVGAARARAAAALASPTCLRSNQKKRRSSSRHYQPNSQKT